MYRLEVCTRAFVLAGRRTTDSRHRPYRAASRFAAAASVAAGNSVMIATKEPVNRGSSSEMGGYLRVLVSSANRAAPLSLVIQARSRHRTSIGRAFMSTFAAAADDDDAITVIVFAAESFPRMLNASSSRFYRSSRVSRRTRERIKEGPSKQLESS